LVGSISPSISVCVSFVNWAVTQSFELTGLPVAEAHNQFEVCTHSHSTGRRGAAGTAVFLTMSALL
jgi:hypothetical protein